MKKKIVLLLSLVVMLMCFFAIAVSAEEYILVDDLGTPSWYTGNYELMTDKTSKVVLSNGDGTYTAYPAYYILKYSITVKDGAVTEAYVNGFDYSFVKEKTGKNYETGAIYKIELPNGLTKITSDYFGLNIKEPNVTEIILPDSMTTVGDHAFRGHKNLKRVVLPKNLLKLGGYAFYESTVLEEVIFTPGSEAELDVSGANIFYKCTSLKKLDISTRNIKAIGNSFLNECTAIGEVKLPDTVETIGDQSFYNCPNLYLASSFLPANLKTAGFHFFSGCKSINNVLYFPDGFEGFTKNYNFSSDKSYPSDLTLVFLGKMEGTVALEMVHASSRKFTLVFAQNSFSDLGGKFVTASNDGTLAYVGVTADTNDTNYIEKTGTLVLNLGNPKDAMSKYKDDENGNTLYYVDAANSINIYFCGGNDVEVCYNVRTHIVSGSYYNYITTPFTFDRTGHMTANKHYDLTKVLSTANCGYDGVVEHTCVVCDRVAKDVDPATGAHTLVDCSACADKCTTCLKYVEKATQNHNLDEIMEYANGFDKSGKHSVICTNEGCTHADDEDIDALFENRGYSYPEDGNSVGISIRFIVDKNAVKAYEDFTGNKINYGLFAGLETSLGNNDVLDQNGDQIDGIIVADLTEGAFTVFEIKMMGFAEAQATTPFAIGAYVTETNGGIKKYSYLQGGTPAENQKYCYVTYSDFAK